MCKGRDRGREQSGRGSKSVKNLREEPMCSGGVARGKKVLYLK